MSRTSSLSLRCQSGSSWLWSLAPSWPSPWWGKRFSQTWFSAKLLLCLKSLCSYHLFGVKMYLLISYNETVKRNPLCRQCYFTDSLLTWQRFGYRNLDGNYPCFNFLRNLCKYKTHLSHLCQKGKDDKNLKYRGWCQNRPNLVMDTTKIHQMNHFQKGAI